MKTLKLDKNNNLLINQSNLEIIEGIEACGQDLTNRLSLVKGESPYNIDDGINYYGEILGTIGNDDYYKDVFRRRILENEEITDVSNVNITRDNNELKLTIDVNTIYGDINKEG
jgi:hypothetical protein